MDRINKTVRMKTLEIEDHIKNQEIVDVEEKVVCRVDRGIKTTQTRQDTVFIQIMKSLAIRMSLFGNHKNKIF